MKKPWYLALFLLVAPASACAQTFEIAPVAGWARFGKNPLGYVSAVEGKDSDTVFRNGYFYGVKLTVNQGNYLGHELTAVETRAHLRTVFQDEENDPRVTRTGRVKLHQLSYNLLAYWMPKGERLRPYWTVGLEGRRSGKPQIEGWPTGAVLNYGINYGGGLKLRLFGNTMVRLDVRDTWVGKPYKLQSVEVTRFGGLVRQMQGSVGIAFGF